MNDFRHAFRLLRRNPGFAAAVIGSLALGVGGVAAMFSLLDGVLLRPLPYQDPDRLVVIWENDRLRGTTREQASTPDYLDIRNRAASYQHLAGWQRLDLTISGEGEPRRVAAARVTESYFPALGVPAPPLKPERRFTALISDSLWRAHFSADPKIAGRTVTLDGEAYTILGVLPPAATIPYHTEQIWIPFAPLPSDQHRGMHNVRIYGRLKPGATASQAQTEINGIMTRLEQEYPGDNLGRGARVVPLHEQVTEGLDRPLYVLLGAVALLLFIAAANVAGLLLARAAARRRDLMVRVALGATRGRLLRQALLDNFVLVACGLAAGLLVAYWSLDLMRAAPLDSVPRLATISLDLRALAVAVIASLLVWLCVTVVSIQVGQAGGLRRPVRPATGLLQTRVDTRQPVRRALVVLEVALSVLLLSGAGLMLRSFWQLSQVDPGYDPKNLLTFSLQLPQSRYPAPKQWPFREWPAVSNFRAQLLEKLRNHPGVTDATIALASPAAGTWTTRMTIGGRPVPPPGQQDEMQFRVVSHEYFRTIRLPIRSGRAFTITDDERHAQVCLINDAFARRYFPGENPLGQTLNIYGTVRQIAGVTGDERFLGLMNAAPPTAYIPHEQFPISSMAVIVRSAVEPTTLIGAIQQHVWSLDGALAAYDVAAVESSLEAYVAQRRVVLILLAAFSATALLLAALGIFGVISFSVSRRTREIGVRMALGAQRGRILTHVLGEGLVVSLAGSAIGLVAALALTRVLTSLLFEVSPHDPLTFLAVTALAICAALAAGLIPARRASNISPMEALRYE
jgi:putative ABC transport system permease protein